MEAGNKLLKLRVGQYIRVGKTVNPKEPVIRIKQIRRNDVLVEDLKSHNTYRLQRSHFLSKNFTVIDEKMYKVLYG